MKDCVFCKIINDELPSEKIFENTNVLVILDVRPVRPGHCLVMPKVHVPTFLDAPNEVLEPLMPVAQKIGRALMEAMNAEGFNLSTNNGRAAGQIIDHLHFHIIPRNTNDGLKHWPQAEYREGEMSEVGKMIRSVIK